MRNLVPALRNNPIQKNIPKLLAFLGIAIVFIAAGAKPAFANHISTAQVAASCTSYTMGISAAQLVTGTNYTITYKLTYTPQTGAATIVTGSIPLVGPPGGNYSTSITKPVNLITDTYKLTGTATLMNWNTVNVSFTQTTLSCSCPD